MRVRRGLVHQHRQRLLRRSAVRGVHLGRLRRYAVRLHRQPGEQGPADRDRREGSRGPGQGAWPVCGTGLSGAAYDGAAASGGTSNSGSSSQESTQESTKKSTEDTRASRSSGRATVETPTGKKVKKGDGEYKVVSGDTLSGIAEKKNVKGGWEKLFELNKDIIDDADFIYPGQQLHLS